MSRGGIDGGPHNPEYQRHRAHSLDDLVTMGSLTAQAARLLRAAVASGLNILVPRGTQTETTGLLLARGAAPSTWSGRLTTMGWKTALDFISAIAWPLVTLVIVGMFRAPLAERITSLKSLSAGPASLEFFEGIGKLQSDVKHASEQDPPKATTATADQRRGTRAGRTVENLLAEAESVANISPRSSLVLGRIALEHSLGLAVRRLDLAEDQRMMSANQYLRQLGPFMSQQWMVVTRDALKLANEAAHVAEMHLPARTVLDFLHSVEQVISYVDGLTRADAD